MTDIPAEEEAPAGIYRFNLTAHDGGPVIAALALDSGEFTEEECQDILAVLSRSVTGIRGIRAHAQMIADGIVPMPEVVAPNRAERRRQAREGVTTMTRAQRRRLEALPVDDAPSGLVLPPGYQG